MAVPQASQEKLLEPSPNSLTNLLHMQKKKTLENEEKPDVSKRFLSVKPSLIPHIPGHAGQKPERSTRIHLSNTQ